MAHRAGITKELNESRILLPVLIPIVAEFADYDDCERTSEMFAKYGVINIGGGYGHPYLHMSMPFLIGDRKKHVWLSLLNCQSGRRYSSVSIERVTKNLREMGELGDLVYDDERGELWLGVRKIWLAL